MVSNSLARPIAIALAMIAISNLTVNADGNPGLTFSDVQLRANAAGMRNSAAYLTITNNGVSDDQLIAVRAAIAKRVEIHSIKMDNGVMRMRAVDSGLAIAVGDSLTLAPYGLHIMFMGLTADLAPGNQHEIILVFEKAGERKLTATVKRPEEIIMNVPGHDASHGQDNSKKSQ